MSVELGTLIGSILAEVTRARLTADVETVQMADLYASDPLLRHMPIPRFRLPDIQIDMPVVIEDIEGGQPSSPPAPPSLPSSTRRKAILKDALKYAGLRLKPAERGEIEKAMAKEVERVESGPRAMAASRLNVDRLERVAAGALGKVLENREGAGDRATRRRFSEAVRLSVQQDLNEQLKSFNRLRVLATTNDVRTQEDSSAVMRLRFSLTEEAYHLTVDEDESGEIRESFGPE